MEVAFQKLAGYSIEEVQRMANTINGNALSSSVNEIRYANSESLFDDAKATIEESRSFAQKAVNVALLRRNWLLGKRIVEEELNSENRAEYGKQVIKTLSK